MKRDVLRESEGDARLARDTGRGGWQWTAVSVLRKVLAAGQAGA